jgi:hypothetical protein
LKEFAVYAEGMQDGSYEPGTCTLNCGGVGPGCKPKCVTKPIDPFAGLTLSGTCKNGALRFVWEDLGGAMELCWMRDRPTSLVIQQGAMGVAWSLHFTTISGWSAGPPPTIAVPPICQCGGQAKKQTKLNINM